MHSIAVVTRSATVATSVSAGCLKSCMTNLALECIVEIPCETFDVARGCRLTSLFEETKEDTDVMWEESCLDA